MESFYSAETGLLTKWQDRSLQLFKSEFPSFLSCLLLEVTFILYEKKVKAKFTNWVIQKPWLCVYFIENTPLLNSSVNVTYLEEDHQEGGVWQLEIRKLFRNIKHI